MPYNDQAQYGGATADYVLTPQMADIYAIQRTCGAATTRLGNDIYGFNSVGFYNFAAYASALAFTIYDSGGTDTLDASGYGMNQTIDLRAGRWSSIGGKAGAAAMRGGAGSDTFASTTSVAAGNIDTITDFSAAADTIRLSRAIFTATSALER